MPVKESKIRPVIEDKRICGGSPVLKGTRVRIMDVVEHYEFLGWSPERISEEFGIGLADAFNALSYYHANMEKIKREIREHSLLIPKKIEARVKA